MDEREKRNLEAWRESIRDQVARLDSVFSDTFSDADKAKVEAAFAKIRTGLDELRRVLRDR